jgi:hypothetical protein
MGGKVISPATSPLLAMLVTALTVAGCASKMTPPEGKVGDEVAADRSECEAEARSARRGEFKLWQPLGPSEGQARVGAAALGLIGGTVKYFVTHEKNFWAIVERCMEGRGYTADMAEPDPTPESLPHNEMY